MPHPHNNGSSNYGHFFKENDQIHKLIRPKPTSPAEGKPL